MKGARAAALLLVALALLAGVSHAQGDHQAPPANTGPMAEAYVDGSLLYTILVDTLQALATRDYKRAEAQALELASAPVPGEIAGIHVRVYTKIAALAESLGELEGALLESGRPSGSLALKVYGYYIELRDLLRYYMDALDRVTPAELRGEYRAEAEALVEGIADLVEELTLGAGERAGGLTVHVSLEPRLVPGGDTAILSIGLDKGYHARAHVVVSVPPAYSWRTTVEFRGRTSIAIPTPTAPELEGLGYSLEEGVLNATIVVRVETLEPAGLEGLAVAALSIEYYPPGVTASIPSSIRAGENLEIRLNTTRPANVTVEIDGVRILGFLLEPPGAVLEVPSGNISPGTHEVTVTVDPWGSYAGAVYRARVRVEGRIPGVEASVPTVALTLTGRVSVQLVLEDGLEYTVEARVDGDTVLEERLGGGRAMVSLPLGSIAPALRTVTIEVRASGEGYEPVKLEYTVLVLNPLWLAVPLALALVLAAYGGAPSLASLVALQWSPGLPRRIARVVGARARGYFEYLRLDLTPSVAVIFYRRALRILGAPDPLPSETLREHYARAVEPRIPRILSSIMGRLLGLTERDLYSHRRPDPRELEESLRALRDAKD